MIIILTINSSWCLFLGWKRVMMIKLFPTWRLFLEFGSWRRIPNIPMLFHFLIFYLSYIFVISLRLFIWKICRSHKNMSTLSILGLINIQEGWVLFWVICINTFFHWAVFVWNDIFVTVQRVTQAVTKCDPGLYIFRVHQRSSVITKHGHMDTGDMGVLSQCLLSAITSCPDSRAHHQGWCVISLKACLCRRGI